MNEHVFTDACLRLILVSPNWCVDVAHFTYRNDVMFLLMYNFLFFRFSVKSQCAEDIHSAGAAMSYVYCIHNNV